MALVKIILIIVEENLKFSSSTGQYSSGRKPTGCASEDSLHPGVKFCRTPLTSGAVCRVRVSSVNGRVFGDDERLGQAVGSRGRPLRK